MLSKNPIERRLQVSGFILILGLLAEGICLMGREPIAFVLFVGLGGLLFAAGILLYLYSLVGVKVESAKQ